jgi:hypothetical protein
MVAAKHHLPYFFNSSEEGFMVFRVIAPDWLLAEIPSLRKVQEGEFSPEQLQDFNTIGYNIYYLPNYPSILCEGRPVDGRDIDTFRYCFADMDLKDGDWPDKETFLEVIQGQPLEPSLIVDSGNGIHVYWEVSDLHALDFLRFQRRLCRDFITDEAVAKVCQLMRVPGYLNTKKKDAQKLCSLITHSDKVYTCEELDKALSPITAEDEAYCVQHHDKTYRINQEEIKVNEKLPSKFGELLRTNQEAKEIWSGGIEDRSKSDYRLGHIMFAQGFTRDEALSVLVNSAKALQRAPIHRISYAKNIMDKIWTHESDGATNAPASLSRAVTEILSAGSDTLKGTRFPCSRLVDATQHGFRLGQVIGLVAGSGVGKTAVALNMFKWFVERNPEYVHFFIPLEQPVNEIADRWKSMCGKETYLHDKVQVISNYADDGSFRHLSFEEIKAYLLQFQQETGKKVGCVVIDHIGALKKKGKDGENQDLMTICHEMKAFAIQTNTLLVMQSQSSREKAGIGDLELNKDAAYGTVYFESYCDYLMTIWQPLKRSYQNPKCPHITAFKFCKIRHKKAGQDDIQEDVPYKLFFDSNTEHLRELTEIEEKSFDFFNKEACNLRKKDRKTDVVSYQSIRWDVNNGGVDGKVVNNPAQE